MPRSSWWRGDIPMARLSSGFDMRIVPRVDPHEFGIEQANAALELVARGHTDGKVVVGF